MRKYLVTGSSGFVAYHFFYYLDSICEKCEVLGLDTCIPNDMHNYSFSNLQLCLVNIDLFDYPNLESEIISFSPTYIIHLASFSSVAKSWIEPIDSFVNNTNIFLNLVEIIRKNNIKCRLLSIGSSEEYGNVPVDCIPIKENVHLQPVSPYAVARVSQEMLSKCYSTSYGLDIIITRSFNHIGPRQRDTFVISSFIKQILENIKSGNIENIKILTGDVSLIRDFTDVRDVVIAYYQLLEKGVSGEIYNICSGKGKSIKEILDILSSILNIHITIEIDEDRIRPNDNKIIIGDNTKIIKQTGWQPQISFEDSLRDIIFYWKQVLNIS